MIKKRDGSLVEFDINRIIQAVFKAFKQTGKDPGDYPLSIGMVTQQQNLKSVEEIQTFVENQLMMIDHDVARNYITYRYEHDRIRNAYKSFIKDIEGLVTLSDEDTTKENANKDPKVFPVQRDLMAGIVSKHMSNKFVPQKILDAHNEGVLHFHDMTYSPFLPMTNCSLGDFKNLLKKGFKLGNAHIETPKSFATACAVTSQLISNIGSYQYGGLTFPNIDIVLAEYADKTFNKVLKFAKEYNIENPLEYAEIITKKEIESGIQGLEYEVNTLFTSNGQFPFITFTFGASIGKWETLIQEAILKTRIKGIGEKGITPVFPKLVMFIGEGINLKKEDQNYYIKQLALECSSKRLYPDIISIKNNKIITGSSTPVSPMSCRSFLSKWVNDDGKEILDSRMNLGVVTLNIPKIALDSGCNEDKFWKLLDERLDLCKEALWIRINRFNNVKAEVAPILYCEGAFGVKMKPTDTIHDLFKNGRASISLGYIGLHELSLLLFKKHPFESKESQEFLLKVTQYLKDKTDFWKKESGYGFSLYSTPAESLCYRFAKIDKKKYGSIEGVTDKDYYTNSFHLDVMHKVSPFDKIDFEAPYHFIATGGHISYIEAPNLQRNLKALEDIWDYALDKLHYFAINTPSDKCFICNYEGEFEAKIDGFTCPKCGNNDFTKMNTVRRTCGYLGNPSDRGFNHGKQFEMINRVKHCS